MSAGAALGLACRARDVAVPLALRSFGNVGIRIFGGRVFNSKSIATGTANGRTYEVLMTTAVPFDAVRVVMAVGNTTGADAITPSVNGAITTVGDPSDTAIGAATWTPLTFDAANDFGGAGTTTLPPAANNTRRAFKVSDIIPISSVARTDGGVYPLLVMRVYLYQSTGAAGNVVVLGNSTQSFANWATHPSGRIWRMLSNVGSYAASGQSGMTAANSAVENGSPIVGVIYYARGKVVNVAGFGDSITEGQGTYIGEGFGFPACQALSQNRAGVAFEWSDLGWSGQATSQIRQNLLDMLSTGPSLKFDVGMLPAGSPNDISTTITPALVTAMRARVAHMQSIIRGAGMTPLLWTWLPSNTAIKAYAATDALRRAYNDDVRGWAMRGAVIADFDSALAGVDDGSGQIQIKAGMTSDGIHPNDAGNALLASIAARALGRMINPVAGATVN